jgi:hypothetical protein
LIPKGVRGNKRSRSEIIEIKEKIRALIYSEDPIYTDEQILAILKIPMRTYYRHKSKIWNEDAPKREQERQDYVRRRVLELRDPISPEGKDCKLF